MRYIIVLLPFFALTNANAATIQQVLVSENKAALAMEAEEKLSAGDVLLATHDGRNCSIKVKSISGALAIADISRCQFKSDLKIGDKVERSLIPVEDTPEIASKASAPPVAGKVTNGSSAAEDLEEQMNENRYRFGGIVYYSTADTMKFEDLTVTTNSGSGTGKVDIKGSGAMGIGASFADLERNSWGYIASFQYEFARSLKTATVTGVNGTAVGTYVNSPKVSFLFIEGNFVYRWEKFYLPFGFNYSIPDITNISTTRFSYTGGLGANVGFGYFTTKNFAVELWSRALAVKATETTGTTTIDYGTGLLTGLGFGLKYWY